jgi:mRNA interferase YafQ
MRIVLQTSRFKKDMRRQLRRGKDRAKLAVVVEVLVTKGTLPSGYSPHPLQGIWQGKSECHLESDWLLIYTVTDSAVILYRTGTHADLFE